MCGTAGTWAPMGFTHIPWPMKRIPAAQCVRLLLTAMYLLAQRWNRYGGWSDRKRAGKSLVAGWFVELEVGWFS